MLSVWENMLQGIEGKATPLHFGNGIDNCKCRLLMRIYPRVNEHIITIFTEETVVDVKLS